MRKGRSSFLRDDSVGMRKVVGNGEFTVLLWSGHSTVHFTGIYKLIAGREGGAESTAASSRVPVSPTPLPTHPKCPSLIVQLEPRKYHSHNHNCMGGCVSPALFATDPHRYAMQVYQYIAVHQRGRGPQWELIIL